MPESLVDCNGCGCRGADIKSIHIYQEVNAEGQNIKLNNNVPEIRLCRKCRTEIWVTLVKAMLEEIAEDIVINYDMLEPTDSPGYTLEGPVIYQGEKHYITLSSYQVEDYKMQAAKQIYSEMVKKHGVIFV